MTKTASDDDGLVVHILRTGYTYPRAGGEFGVRSEVGHRGQVVHLTPDDVAASRDRAGNSCWSLSPQEQFDRWGEQRFGIGEWPADVPVLIPGSQEFLDAREQARREAWSLPDGPQRASALAEVVRHYGGAPVTSRTLGVLMGDEQRQAVLEAEGRL